MLPALPLIAVGVAAAAAGWAGASWWAKQQMAGRGASALAARAGRSARGDTRGAAADLVPRMPDMVRLRRSARVRPAGLSAPSGRL